jgi:membrane fusion protein (multidrug efflux system)
MTSQTQTLPVDQVPADELPARRKKLFVLLGGAIAAAAIGYGIYWKLYASHFVSTDNAYVAAEVAQITAEVGGTVQRVLVTDTQKVKKGDVLVQLNDSDAKLALAQAQAELERAERRVRGYLANDGALNAQVQARQAEQSRSAAQLASAKSDLERAQLDFKRREALVSNGSVSAEELSNARNALTVAESRYRDAEAADRQSAANYRAATEALKSNQTLTEGTPQNNPEVVLARARRDQAKLDLQRTVIQAPIDGVIAKRQVQLGQRVQAGSPLLSVVPVQQMHVDANFKEVQLDKVKLGQSVQLTSDLYGSHVVYHGKVTGLSGGSGSAFAVIPAQNATGNWIKVVQRLPVRIALDPSELQKHPLSVGLSMTATIDTGTH